MLKSILKHILNQGKGTGRGGKDTGWGGEGKRSERRRREGKEWRKGEGEGEKEKTGKESGHWPDWHWQPLIAILPHSCASDCYSDGFAFQIVTVSSLFQIVTDRFALHS